MPTRIASNGDATYYYFVDEKNRPVKHGRFKYTLRQTRGSSKIYQDINGNYANGYKNGTWSYRTKFKDYKMDRSTEYLTGTMTLTADYENGIPHGIWKFRYTRKTREQEAGSGGRMQWSAYSNTELIILSMNFKELVLCDSIFIQSNDGSFAEGVLTKEGHFNGIWNLESKTHFTREKYNAGLLYKKEIFDKKDTMLIESSDFSNLEMKRRDNIKNLNKNQPEKVQELTYTLDTISVFKTAHVIPAMITKWIFENPYLLFKDLDGDNYDLTDLKGGYIVHVVNHVTPAQREKIAMLEDHLATFKQVNIRIENLCRGKAISDRIKSTIQLMTYYERIAEKYLCMAKSLTSLPDFADANKGCEKKCENTIKLLKELPEFHSREEALAFFLNDLNEKSQSMHAYEDMLRNDMSFR